MDFPYKQLNKITRRPIINILVRNNNESLNYEVLIDSGADHNLFNAEIAEEIGINVKGGKFFQTQGVGGVPLDCWLHEEVTLFVPGVSFVTVPVAFTFGLPPEGHGLVGQLGFFDQFTIKFDYRNGVVRITKPNDREPS